jgi:hypothetical protein
MSLAAVGALGFAGHEAAANVSSAPGISFHPASGSQAGLVSIQSYGGLSNISSSYVDVVGQIPYQSGSALYVTGNFSHNTYCYAAVTNGVGNASWLGSTQYGQTSGLSVQTLSLGTPPLYSGTGLLVHCVLEPGAYVGLAWQ